VDLIKLKAAHIDLIWGSEDWLISAHQNGEAIIDGGEYDGLKLSTLFKQEGTLFGKYEGKEFPLLMKIIDAKTPLSIQVHPGDEYAKKNEQSLGKTECWYILDEKNTDIVIGQKAENREELEKAIIDKKSMELMEIFTINKGDFFYIPAGTVHAIRKDTKILEIQQSSDVTYRLYDYDRLDKNGKKRELHIDKSLDVINYQFKNNKNIQKNVRVGNVDVIELVNEKYFYVHKIQGEINGVYENTKDFLLGVIIEGEFTINNEKITPNIGFIIPNNKDLKIKGKGILIISSPNN